VAGGEKVGLARVQATGPGDTQTGEREDAVSRREEEVLLREGWVGAREEAAVSKAERQLPLEQMKEANEELTLQTEPFAMKHACREHTPANLTPSTIPAPSGIHPGRPLRLTHSAPARTLPHR
jgi:hypothetical protein